MTDNPPLRIHVEDSTEEFTKIHDAEGSASGIGHFFLHIKVTALQNTLYVPLSIASSKKPTGFVYQIEGTGDSSIESADISLKDIKESGITQILLGTITYCEIPQGKTATFRVSIDIKGKIGREYAIVINRIQYKLNPTDTRYQKYTEEIRTSVLKFH
jgi:hypothetical protein